MAVTPPTVDRDSRFFWDGVRAGQLLLQRCTDCGELRHPPGPMCPACGCLDWKSEESTGRGTVYSWVLSRHPTEADAEPRIVVLVDLEDGVRMVANLVGVPVAEVANDLPVEVFFTEIDGVPLPVFRRRDV
jgi:uncharacterized OB-fold protein